MFTIRTVTEEDFEEIVRLERSCGLSSHGVAGFQRLLGRGPAWIILGAFSGDGDGSTSALIGVFSGTVVVDEFQVDNLAVATRYRRKGIGIALVENALARAFQLGAVSAVLEVRDSNEPAKKLYARCGFEIAGKRVAYYREPEEDALLLTRALTTSTPKMP